MTINFYEYCYFDIEFYTPTGFNYSDTPPRISLRYGEPLSNTYNSKNTLQSILIQNNSSGDSVTRYTINCGSSDRRWPHLCYCVLDFGNMELNKDIVLQISVKAYTYIIDLGADSAE